MLGGSLYQTYAIKEAKRLGYYVITADYLPTNPGHKFADEYHNVSTTDKEAVLQLATELRVDGVIAYASDPAAPTAAYVCEKLGLPTSPYKSVEILSNKDLFRDFLQKNGFVCPKAMGFTTYEEALMHIDDFHLPVMVKPVDSSGSKGINKMTDKSQLKAFVADALSYSRSKRFLIEEFIVKKGYHISGDAFSFDGKLVFHCFGNEFYDQNCDKDFVPLGECWPFQMDHKYIEDLEQQLQRVISILQMKSTAYNVEAIVGEDDNVYLLELGARSGGSLIPQVIEYATGVNMVSWVIQTAAGDNIDLSILNGNREMPIQGYWSNYMVHSDRTGSFCSISFDPSFEKKHIVDFVNDLKTGNHIHRFRDTQDCIGELILQYESMEQMFATIKMIEQKINIDVYDLDVEIRLSKEEVIKLLQNFGSTSGKQLMCDDAFYSYCVKLSERAFFLLIRNKDICLGYLAYYLNPEGKFIYATRAIVDGLERRKGIGHMMFDTLERYYNKQYHSIRLEVLKSNSNAHSFYIQEGFYVSEDRKERLLLCKNI